MPERYINPLAPDRRLFHARLGEAQSREAHQGSGAKITFFVPWVGPGGQGLRYRQIQMPHDET